MAALRQYVISVTAAAIICGILMSLSPKGAAMGILKMLCGIFLAFLVIQPITKLDVEGLISEFTMSYSVDGETAAAFGEELMRDSLSQRIKAETEAYILDKADGLGATLDADVTVSEGDTPLPVAVTLRGSVSSYVKQQLEQILFEDLGISKENQLWIG